MLSDVDKRLLRDLESAAASRGVDFSIVGAGARLLIVDMPLGVSGRTTSDWDVALRMASWQQFERFRTALLEGAFEHTNVHHRLRHRDGGLVDLIPFGPLESPSGTIVWPSDESRMDVTGFDASVRRGLIVTLGEDLQVPVVPAPGLAVLKLRAYLDRRSSGVDHDLHDADLLLRSYEDLIDEDRVFGEASEPIRSGALDIRHVGAYLLGADAAGIFEDVVLAPVREWIRGLEPYDRSITVLTPRTLAEDEEERHRSAVLERFKAFDGGVAASQDRGGAR